MCNWHLIGSCSFGILQTKVVANIVIFASHRGVFIQAAVEIIYLETIGFAESLSLPQTRFSLLGSNCRASFASTMQKQDCKLINLA